METSRVAAIPLFADLPEDELAAVAGLASEAEIESGQALSGEGHIGHSLFAIESGTADVVIGGATVRSIACKTLSARWPRRPHKRSMADREALIRSAPRPGSGLRGAVSLHALPVLRVARS